MTPALLAYCQEISLYYWEFIVKSLFVDHVLICIAIKCDSQTRRALFLIAYFSLLSFAIMSLQLSLCRHTYRT